MTSLHSISSYYSMVHQQRSDGREGDVVGCMHAIQTQVQIAMAEDFDDDATMSVTDIKQIQISLIKQVLKIIESKGLSR